MDTTTDDEFYSDGRLLVDFNYAYNHNLSCPISPSENRIMVPIVAGEKTYVDVESH